ncbi:MAG: hypothetical protein ABSA46_20140 [Thermodesulfovibrionales bacterium]|jgi:hypothetical protein
MSEVIMDYAEPLLNCSSEDEGSKGKAISIAIMCWNLSLLPQDVRKEEKGKILNSLPNINAKDFNDAEYVNDFETLLVRI